MHGPIAFAERRGGGTGERPQWSLVDPCDRQHAATARGEEDLVRVTQQRHWQGAAMEQERICGAHLSTELPDKAEKG